jgi:rfaE bifunctional protein kinase chain/domain
MENKVKTLEELKPILEDHKKQGKKIVHCHGVFDLIHFGHLQHFLAAKKQGDILVVTLTPDRFIQKGPERPFFNEDIRLKHLSYIEFIDYVSLNNWPTAVETIKIIQPDIYAKGKEVLANKDVDKLNEKGGKKSNLAAEEEIVQSFGGKLYLTDEMTFSSSRIINSITSALSEDTKEYLRGFRKEFNTEQILEVLDSLKDLRVLVLGDAIFDEYAYCHVMGKASKEPIVPYKFLNSEVNLGGVFNVANHIANFVKDVSLVTCIGNNDYDFIETGLNNCIERNIFVQNDSQTIVKKRYLDAYKGFKIFEVYNVDELKINQDTEEKILRFLENNLSRFDLIVLSDFGHGLLTPKLIEYIGNCNKFVAINCQLNAGNSGYNFITKYKKADFVSLNETELRLPFQEKNSNIEIPINKLSSGLNLDKINITLGKSGSVYFQENNHHYVPSFTKDPVDTIGAGDIVLSLTSLLAYKGIRPEIIPFLGNSIGALAVKIIGNKRSVDPQELKKFVAYILK